jgi:uncharacterized glyoxalase superfamily protein PhnB
MKFKSLAPNMAVKDVKATVEFYHDILGFNLLMAVPETQDCVDDTLIDGKAYVYAMVGCDSINIMFQREDSFREDVILAEGDKIGASVTFYFELDGLDDFYAGVKDKVAKKTEIITTWYGQREFYLIDNNGYILGFAESNVT